MESLDAQTRTDMIHALEGRLEHTFTKSRLLTLALTHSSWANEKNAVESGDQVIEHNERMEFLGDAVLELCISHILFHRYPTLREGALTKIRSNLVSTNHLARIAKELSLDQLVCLGHGEELQGGRSRSSILSDTFEAVLAAVYVDGGFADALKTVQAIFTSHLEEAVAAVSSRKDHKTMLQEQVQQRYRDIPVYTLKNSYGPEHAKIFTIELKLPDGQIFEADGSSYKKAEQETARRALEYLKNKKD